APKEAETVLETNSRSYRVFTAGLIYLVAIGVALSIATLRSRAKKSDDSGFSLTDLNDADSQPRPASAKPFFSLSTHRTYGSSDNARMWVDYQGIDHLDFRVYQVKDPRK